MKKLKELFLKNKKLFISVVACCSALVFSGVVFGIIALSLNSGDGGKKDDVPAAHKHQWVEGVSTATCLEDGEIVFTCSVEGCTETHTQKDVAKGHVGGTATCEQKAECSVCGMAYGDFADHSVKTNPAVTATCDMAGSTESSYCSVCKEVIVAATRVDALGHNWSFDAELGRDVCGICGEKSSEDLEYRLVSNKYYMVVGVGNNRDTKIIVPSTHLGLPVKVINDDVFETYSVATSFETISADMTIKAGAFRGCEKLERVVIGDVGEGETIIEGDAFSGCKNLEEVVLGKGVKKLGYGAFSGCEKLAHLTLGENVTSIEQTAFKNCTSLVSIELPKTLTYLGGQAFYGCTALENVTIYEGITAIDDSTFYGCKSLKEISIPESVVVIGSYAFYACDSLTDVALGVNVETVGVNAFEKCKNLRVITFNDALVNVGVDAFLDATALKEVHVSSVAKWTEITFENGKANPFSTGADLYIDGAMVSSVVIPDEVTEVKAYAFYAYKNMNEVTIGKGVTSIAPYAFAECSGLSAVNYNAVACAMSEGNIFYRAGKNMALTVGAEVQYVPAGLFYTEDLMMGNDYAASNLASITIVEGSACKSIGEKAFANCIKLTKINLGDSVEELSVEAFANAVALKNVVISDKVALVGADVFYNCMKVETVTAPATVLSSIAKDSLKTLKVTSGSVPAEVMKKAPKLTNVTFGAGVTDIESEAFYNCAELTGVVIEDSVKVIGQSAFADCAKLKKVVFGSKLEEICDSAFANCEELSELSWSESLKVIGYRAFYRCGSIKHFVLSEKMTKIYEEAFKLCLSLETVDFVNRLSWTTSSVTLDSSDLADPNKAANYLTEKYCDKVWTCQN